MAKEIKSLAGQKSELVLQTLEKIFSDSGDMTPIHMKNHLAITFFRMVMNEESVDDSLRNMARSYLQLYEFLSTFDEVAAESNV